MNRALLPRYRPRLETLEERCTPSTSTTSVFLPHGVDLARAALVTGVVSHGDGGQQGVAQAASAVQGADSRVIPFMITGGGPAPNGLPLTPGSTVPHQATGTATHLGKYTGEGTFVLGSLSISPTGAVTGTFEGSFVFVAANGDRLAVTYGDGFTGVFTGQLTADSTAVVNAKFDAVFTPDPGNSTGRFADVIGGGFRMIAHAESISLISSVPGFTAPFNYTWNGEGSLVFGKGKTAASDGRMPDATINTGRPMPPAAQRVAFAPWVSVDPNQTVASDWATLRRVRVG